MKYKWFKLLRYLAKFGKYCTEDGGIIDDFTQDMMWMVNEGWVELGYDDEPVWNPDGKFMDICGSCDYKRKHYIFKKNEAAIVGFLEKHDKAIEKLELKYSKALVKDVDKYFKEKVK